MKRFSSGKAKTYRWSQDEYSSVLSSIFVLTVSRFSLQDLYRQDSDKFLTATSAEVLSTQYWLVPRLTLFSFIDDWSSGSVQGRTEATI